MQWRTGWQAAVFLLIEGGSNGSIISWVMYCSKNRSKQIGVAQCFHKLIDEKSVQAIDLTLLGPT
jgi:hypothetical protein